MQSHCTEVAELQNYAGEVHAGERNTCVLNKKANLLSCVQLRKCDKAKNATLCLKQPNTHFSLLLCFIVFFKKIMDKDGCGTNSNLLQRQLP